MTRVERFWGQVKFWAGALIVSYSFYVLITSMGAGFQAAGGY